MSKYQPETIAEVLRALSAEKQKISKNVGQIVCIGIDAIRERLGEKRWERIKERVATLITKSIDEICSPKDIYFRCRDASVLIVFAEPDPLVAKAVGARIAKKVNDSLFGSDDLEGLTVQSVVETVDGLVIGDDVKLDEIVDLLHAHSNVIQVASTTGPDEQPDLQTPPPDAATSPDSLEVNLKPVEAGVKLPSFRSEMIQLFQTVTSNDITFQSIPIWDVKVRLVNIFSCVPKRQSAIAEKAVWEYAVLGDSATSNEIVDLDIAGLEKGLIEITPHLIEGRSVHLAPNIHFETLASKKGRDELRLLLSAVPEQVRMHLFPNIMYIPDGVPETRLAELTGHLKGLTNFLCAALPGEALPQKNFQPIHRLKTGGFHGILVRMPRSASKEEIKTACEFSDKILEVGCAAAASWISDVATLMALSYSSFVYCSGTAIGGPFDAIPAPYGFDGRNLEISKATDKKET